MNSIRSNKIILPSNKKFGYFFTFIFLISSTYFYLNKVSFAFFIFGFAALFFLIITTFKADFLTPLNKLWMALGMILGMIVSPIIMGVIFFLIFTPIGILMRLFGRDELALQFKKKPSYWNKRNEDIQSNSFKAQF